jgi:polysaccharide biosynthesis/export protein
MWVGLAWLAAVVLLSSAQAANGQEKSEPTQQKSETTQQTNDRIQQLASMVRAQPTDMPLGLGDLIHIDVFDVPELSRDVRVSDTGEIYFPLIREPIRAAGLTPVQLQSELETLLAEKGLVSHPNVSVFVRELNSQPISVVGAVNHTLVYQVTRPTTLLEVLSAAGGVSPNAGDTIVITRPELENTAGTKPVSESTNNQPQEQKIMIRLRDLLQSGDSVYNIPVYGGDIITVPEAGVVYVLGFGVAQPGEYVLQGHGERITVLEAIAIAHGLTGFAKANDTAILRDNPATGKRDEIPVRLKDIQNHKIDDVPLQSNDILYVPDSKGKKALARGAEAAIGIGTGLAIYGVE